jgi:hypothetical protein
MKKYMWFAKYISAFMLVQWAMWSYVMLEPNPLAWSTDIRFVTSMITMILFVCAACMAQGHE